MDKFENFKAIWTFTRHFDNISQTNKLWQKIILFVFQPTKRGLSLLTCYSMQCPEHCPLNRTNKGVFFFFFFLSKSSTLQLISSYAPKRSLAIKKKNAIFWEFSGILEFFWRILDISKGILELFFGKFRKEFLGYMELSLRLNEVMIKKMIRICHCLQKNRACKTTVWTIAKEKGKKRRDACW